MAKKRGGPAAIGAAGMDLSNPSPARPSGAASDAGGGGAADPEEIKQKDAEV